MNPLKISLVILSFAIFPHVVAQDLQRPLPALPEALLLLETEAKCRRHITELEKPTYPEEAQRIGIQGEVLAFVWFDKDGALIETKILRTPHESLSNAVLKALNSWRLAPDAPLYPEANYMSELRFVFVLKDGNAEVVEADKAEQEKVSSEFTKEIERRKKQKNH